MSNEKVVAKLAALAQLDIDAAFAYDQALSNIDDKEIHASLTEFREDHVRHVKELNEIIRELGGEPVSFSQDFKGFMIEGFTAIRSMTGEEGALKAMQGNEILTTTTYERALKDDEMPANARALVEKNFADEQRHLAYIKQMISII